MNKRVDIARRLVNDLKRDFGLADHQAAAFVGNLAYESGGFEKLQEITPLERDSRGGWGYAQWTDTRRDSFDEWASQNGLDPRSYEANYGFIRHELINDPLEKRALLGLFGAKDVNEASDAVMDGYLRPHPKYKRAGRRREYSRQIYQSLGHPASGPEPERVAAPLPTMRPDLPADVLHAPEPNPQGFAQQYDEPPLPIERTQGLQPQGLQPPLPSLRPDETGLQQQGQFGGSGPAQPHDEAPQPFGFYSHPHAQRELEEIAAAQALQEAAMANTGPSVNPAAQNAMSQDQIPPAPKPRIQEQMLNQAGPDFQSMPMSAAPASSQMPGSSLPAANALRELFIQKLLSQQGMGRR